MKLRLESSVCAILCILPSICSAQARTLDECVSTALAHNRSIQISVQGARGAEGRVTEAKGAGRLQVNAFAAAQDRSGEEDLPLAVSIDDNRNLVFRNAPIIPSAASSVGLSLTKAIDIGGMVRAGTRAARLGAETATLNVGRTRNDVVLQTKIAYYDVLRNEAMVGVAQESMKNARIRKDTAQALVDTGINSKVDVVRADASISSAQQQIIGAQNAVKVSKSVLNRTTGDDVNAEIEVESPAEEAFMVASYDDYLAEAYAKRPEVATAAKSVAMAEEGYKLAKRGTSPSLVASASAEIDNSYHCPEDRTTTVGLSLVIPLSDGGVTTGRRTQAASEIDSARLAEAETKAQVALQVTSAYVHVQNSAEKLDTARKELDQATESLRLSRSRYAEGIANQVELSDAEMAFTQAQTNVVNSRFDLLGSHAELEWAVGRHSVMK